MGAMLQESFPRSTRGVSWLPIFQASSCGCRMLPCMLRDRSTFTLRRRSGYKFRTLQWKTYGAMTPPNS